MQRIFLITFFLLLNSCSRPEIKNPEDIISTDAKVVIYAPSIKRLFNFLPRELMVYSKVTDAFAEPDLPVALVLTSLDPLEAYLAIPSKKNSEEQLQKEIDEQLFLDSEYWSGYVFVALKGSIPSSFGNKEFLPENKDAALYVKVTVPELIEGNEQKLESYKKYKSIRGKGLLPSAGRILTRFLTHDFVEFSKQVESYELICDEEGVVFNTVLKEGSEQAGHYNAMSDYKLPEVNTGDSDIAFSLAADFSKLDFPVKSLETAFKSYLSSINKGDTIFPMDTVFDKLRDAQKVRSSGSFKIIENKLSGVAEFEADEQDNLNDSVLKFAALMAPEFFSALEGNKAKVLRPLSLPMKTVEADLDVIVKEDVVILSDNIQGDSKITMSEQKGLLKVILEPSLFTSFDTAKKKLFLKATVEENLLKLKASLKEN